jgi:ketosteroid isomerase-like protein
MRWGCAAVLVSACAWLAGGSSFARADRAARDGNAQEAIRAVLVAQAAAWNRGDIEGFMAGYWKSEETTFVGASGVTKGWQSVLDRYRRNYPDKSAMGRLTFGELEIHMLSRDAAYIVGQWQLDREKDRPGGVFTLIARRFPEGWRIIHDHTTAYAATKPAGSQ